MTLLRSKLLWVAMIVLVIGGVTGVVDFPDGEPDYGPRRPGIEKRFNCRYMTVEASAIFTDQQRKNGVKTLPGRMEARLGTAGNVNEPVILVDWKGLYKREFCARPGSDLYAMFVASEPVDNLECYFMFGPDDGKHDATHDHGPPTPRNYKRGAPNQVTAWCIGVVPA